MPHHVILWLQYCKDIFLLPKMNETNLITNHSFLLICQIKILLSLSVFQHLFYCNFNNFWKTILRKDPSLLPPILFLHFYTLC